MTGLYLSTFTGAQVDSALTNILTNKLTRSATLVIAASNSSAKSKAQADYVCDGTADDVEIQAAIDALPESGGSIFLLGGTYTLNCSVSNFLNGLGVYWTALMIVGKNIKMYGEGVGITILRMADNQNYSSHPALLVWAKNYTSLTVSDMTLDGNNTNQTYYNWDGNGLILTGGVRKGLILTNLHLINSPGCGLYLGNNGNGCEQSCIVNNLYFYNCWMPGLWLDECQNSVVSNIICDSCGTGGNYGGVSLYAGGAISSHTSRTDNLLMSNIQVVNGSASLNYINSVNINGLSVYWTADVYYGAVEITDCYNLNVGLGRVLHDSSVGYGLRLNGNENSNIQIQLGILEGNIGVEAAGSANVTISGGMIKGTTFAALVIDNGNLRLHGVELNAPASTGYTLSINDTGTLEVVGCTSTSIGCPIYITPGTFTHKGNDTKLGLESSGSTNFTASSTLVITHGLSHTPTKVIAIGSDANSNALWVSDIGETTFTVNRENSTGTPAVYWHAEV
jgi:hypothetical protein